MVDKLYFYSKSRDVYPGKGTKENVHSPEHYVPLSHIPKWRQLLSNFSEDGQIKYAGFTYRTIEHAFQATKIAIVDQEAARQFALESNSCLSKGSGADAQKQRKMRRLNDDELKTWETRQAHVLVELWRCKAAHCELFRTVLLLTNQAQLWHVQNRKPAVRWIDLENVRDSISQLS